MSAKLKILPSELVHKSTISEQYFLEYWVRKLESEDSEKIWYLLNRALGTLWEKSDFEVREKGYKTHSPDRVWYPLSILLAQTDIRETIKKDLSQKGQEIGGGEYVPAEHEEVENLALTTSKEEFLDFMRRFSGSTPMRNDSSTSEKKDDGSKE